MIDLATIDNHKKADVRKLVAAENTTRYEIYVPKSTEEVFTGPETVADDYALAAYAGQLLAGVSTEFTYEEVEPEQQQSIRFDLSCDNPDALADVLLHISYGYANEHEDLDFNFFEEVFDFIDEVADDKVVPACPVFIEIFEEYAELAENEDEGDDEG